MFRDEVGKYAVASGKWKGGRRSTHITWIGKGVIESKQQNANKKKANELGQNDATTGQQRHNRLSWPVGTQITLHQVLISTVSTHRKKATTAQSGPEGVGLRVV